MASLTSKLLITLQDGVSAQANRIRGALSSITAQAAAVGKRTQGLSKNVSRIQRQQNGVGFTASAGAGMFLANELRFQEAMNRTKAIMSGDLMDTAAAWNKELGADVHDINTVFDKHRQKVIELSKVYPATSAEIAKGASELAMSGMSFEQVNAVLEAAVQGSMASGESIRTVGEGVTDVILGMGKAMTNDSFMSFNDTLAAAATSYNQTYTGFLAGLQKTAPMTKLAGLGLQDMTAILGTLANAGFKAQVGGTAMRTSFIRMMAPAAKGRAALKALTEAGYMQSMDAYRGDANASLLRGAEGAERLAALMESAGVQLSTGSKSFLADYLNQLFDSDASTEEIATKIKGTIQQIMDDTGTVALAGEVGEMTDIFLGSAFDSFDSMAFMRDLAKSGAHENAEIMNAIFGKRHFAKMVALLDAMVRESGTEGLSVFDEQMKKFERRIPGATARFAGILLEGLPGALREMSSAFDALLRGMANSGAIDDVSAVFRSVKEGLNYLSADPVHELLKQAHLEGREVTEEEIAAARARQQSAQLAMRIVTLSAMLLGVLAPIGFVISGVTAAFTTLASVAGVFFSVLKLGSMSTGISFKNLFKMLFSKFNILLTVAELVYTYFTGRSMFGDVFNFVGRLVSDPINTLAAIPSQMESGVGLAVAAMKSGIESFMNWLLSVDFAAAMTPEAFLSSAQSAYEQAKSYIMALFSGSDEGGELSGGGGAASLKGGEGNDRLGLAAGPMGGVGFQGDIGASLGGIASKLQANFPKISAKLRELFSNIDFGAIGEKLKAGIPVAVKFTRAAFERLAQVMTRIYDVVLPTLAAIYAATVGKIMQSTAFVERIVNGVTHALGRLIYHVRTISTLFVEVLGRAWTAFIAVVSFGLSVLNVAGRILMWVGSILWLIGQTIVNLWNIGVAAFNAIVSVLSIPIRLLQGLYHICLGIITLDFSKVTTGVDRFLFAFTDAYDKLYDFFASIGSFFVNLYTNFKRMGDATHGLVGALFEFAWALGAALQEVGEFLWYFGALGVAIVDFGRDLLKAAGWLEETWDQFLEIIEWQAIKDAVVPVLDAIESALTNFDLSEIGTGWVQSLLDGILSMADAVTSAFSDMIPDAPSLSGVIGEVPGVGDAANAASGALNWLGFGGDEEQEADSKAAQATDAMNSQVNATIVAAETASAAKVVTAIQAKKPVQHTSNITVNVSNSNASPRDIGRAVAQATRNSYVDYGEAPI